jgi:hypothetical protein
MNFITKQPGGTLPAGSRRRRKPRGVLLLIVLSMLTLFMMLGTTYMVVTSRARATARAFARASAAEESAGGAAGRRMVDDAFRILARGTTSVDCKEPSLLRGDDLLGDKYGRTLPGPRNNPINGRFLRIDSVAAGVSGPGLIDLSATQVDLNGNPSGDPLPLVALGGRILTVTLPGMCRSGRIVRAAYATPNSPDPGHLILTIPSTSPVDGVETRAEDIDRGVKLAPNDYHAVINGREHAGDATAGDSNEAYDGFGAVPNNPNLLTDPFLASLVGTDVDGNAYDAYDNPDQSIQPGVAVAKMSFFPRETDPATPTVLPEVDNDADGVLDSKWIDVGFPMLRADDGTTYRAQAAYLVLDLDSRLSLNAHGSPFQLEAMLTASDVDPVLRWPTQGTFLPADLTDQEFGELAYGSGYGPAEVRIWDLFFNRPGWLPDPAEPADKAGAQDVDSNGRGFFYGLPVAKDQDQIFNPPPAMDAAQKRPPLAIRNIPGRYGAHSGASLPPGDVGNDALSLIRDENRHPNHAAVGGARFPKSIADSWRVDVDPTAFATDPDQYSSPSDLSGRMRVVADSRLTGDGLVSTDGIVSQMWYVKPEGSWYDDTIDDPYEIRLGRNSAFDNPFRPDELERVLRVYDWDASQLPTRLTGLLGTDAERLRFLLTTDSWDSTAIVGDTWRQIEDVLRSRPFDPAMLVHLLGPELMTGRRLDLNRQIDLADGSGPARRDALCRNLYTLLWTLVDDPTGAKPTSDVCRSIAQWAVNVVDFRDTDSTMSVFFYDEDPSDGWSVDEASSPFAIGHERPEVLITEALCWKNEDGDEGGVHVVLHHPWAAKALDGSSVLPYDQDGNSILGPDVLDPHAVAPELAALDPSDPTNPLPMNAVDLGLLGGNDPDSPVWRLRLGTSATAAIIRFDIRDPSAITPDPMRPEYWSGSTDEQERYMAPDSWLSVSGDRGNPAGPSPMPGGGLSQQLVINQMDDVQGGPLPSADAGTTDQVILLERLADPRLPHQPDPSNFNQPFNPYIEVDRIGDVAVADRTEVEPGSGVPRQYYAATRRTMTGTTSSVFWQQQFDPGTLVPPITDPASYDPANEDQIDTLSPSSGSRVAWFPWLNRPFISPVELALVPSALVEVESDASGLRFRSRLLADYTGFAGNGWLDILATSVGLPSDVLVSDLFQATIVPSRFADLATSVADPMVFDTDNDLWTPSTTGLDLLASNHFSGWREPGRVNLNTVSDDRVWDATVRRGQRAPTVSSPGDGLDRSDASFGIPPLTDPTSAPQPAETLLDIYGLEAGADAVFADPAGTPGQEPGDNPELCCLTAGRLANVATNRSSVFAIWVTVGFFECNPAGGFVMVKDQNGNPIPKELGSDTGSTKRHRGFYIFDRSIPVGYVTGRDLNLEDAIRLRRIIQ